MQPSLDEASCIFIQYSWNDFQENSVFLTRGGLPAPTTRRFEQLVSGYERKRVWFLDVMRQVFDMMVDYPIAFFLNVIGLHEFPLGDDDPLDSKGGAPRDASEDAKAFLAVLAAFPELNRKQFFVIGPGRFIAALKRQTLPANVFPIQVDLSHAGWFTLDMSNDSATGNDPGGMSQLLAEHRVNRRGCEPPTALVEDAACRKLCRNLPE